MEQKIQLKEFRVKKQPGAKKVERTDGKDLIHGTQWNLRSSEGGKLQLLMRDFGVISSWTMNITACIYYICEVF